MSATINRPTTHYFTEEKARALAADLNLEAENDPIEERWTYQVEERSDTMSPHRWCVRYYDENGERGSTL